MTCAGERARVDVQPRGLGHDVAIERRGQAIGSERRPADQLGCADDVERLVPFPLLGRLPGRSLIDQGLQRFSGAASVEPVRHVALWWQVGQVDDLDRARMVGEVARYVLRMLAAAVVIVGNDHHGLVGKPVAEAREPLADAAGFVVAQKPAATKRSQSFSPSATSTIVAVSRAGRR